MQILPHETDFPEVLPEDSKLLALPWVLLICQQCHGETAAQPRGDEPPGT